MNSLFKKVLKGNYEWISNNYSKNLSIIIQKLLQVNPSLRPNWGYIIRLNLIIINNKKKN